MFCEQGEGGTLVRIQVVLQQRLDRLHRLVGETLCPDAAGGGANAGVRIGERATEYRFIGELRIGAEALQCCFAEVGRLSRVEDTAG